MITQDVCNFYNAHSVYNSYGGIVFGEEEGLNIAKSLGQGKGCILMNHGLLTVGGTVDEAAFLYGLMERSCQIQLLADAAEREGRRKVLIKDEEAQYNFEGASDPVGRVVALWEPSPDECSRKHCFASFSLTSTMRKPCQMVILQDEVCRQTCNDSSTSNVINSFNLPPML